LTIDMATRVEERGRVSVFQLGGHAGGGLARVEEHAGGEETVENRLGSVDDGGCHYANIRV